MVGAAAGVGWRGERRLKSQLPTLLPDPLTSPSPLLLALRNLAGILMKMRAEALCPIGNRFRLRALTAYRDEQRLCGDERRNTWGTCVIEC